MNKFRLTLRILAIATFMFALASLAQAQATRTWVSGVGDDVNPCSRTAPCKTFAGAISKTAAGGEIDALDPGGYGTVTCTKSITIAGDGTMASILSSGVPAGLNVNGAGIKVHLRNININGAGTTLGTNGINFTNGAGLWVEDCTFENFSNIAISIPSSTGNNELHLKNVNIRNAVEGVHVVDTGAFTTMMTGWNVQITNTTTAVNCGTGARGHMSFSNFGFYSSAGLSASSNADITLQDCSITGMGAAVGSTIGINTSGTAHARIVRCVITHNVNALGLGAVVDTGGNNTIMDNGTNQDPNGTLFQQK
jgi:hypothetical protein